MIPTGGPGNNNTSGCEAADFAGFPAGSIALMQRGTCTFGEKAPTPKAAGAVAASSSTRARSAGPPSSAERWAGRVTIPAVETSFDVGNGLRNGVLNGPTGVTMRVRVDRVAETRTTYNVIADRPGGDPNSVIVVGAHLDSVSRGPGINDNGTGSAAILEVAEQMRPERAAQQGALRLVGRGGARAPRLRALRHLAWRRRDGQIALNLNFDMIGSPNFVRFVYDGETPLSRSARGAVGPEGSGEIEQDFHDYFARGPGLAPDSLQRAHRLRPVHRGGIPAGGLFTGAEGIKTAEQAEVYGGPRAAV